jgi:hypothetical protein
MTPVTARLWFPSLSAIVAIALVSTTVLACTVPVFRYALERWPPDDYLLTVFHRGPLSSEDKETTERLQTAFSGNIVVETIDLTRSLDEATEELWEAQSTSCLGFRRMPSPVL